MSRKTATATKTADQPDLLSGAGSAMKPKQEVATATRSKSKGGEIVPLKEPTLIDRLKQVSNAADVAIAREILAMIRGEEDRKSAQAFNAEMLTCQSAIPPITRNSYNKHTESKWAKLEKISRIADPIIRKHGFVLSYGMATSPLAEHYRVVCDVSHRDGHTRRYEADVGMDSKGPQGKGNKSLAQGSGSSITYARRYLKVMIFDIVIEGEDNDGNGSRGERSDKVIEGTVESGGQVTYAVDDDEPKITQKQCDQLIEALEEKGIQRVKFCKPWKINTVAELPAEHFTAALQAVKDYGKR